MRFEGILEYNEDSPSCLVWACDKQLREGVVVARKGLPAGGDDGLYYRVGYTGNDGLWYREKCHRIVWEMHNGEIPEGMCIDHIDRNKLNNKIDNLRLVTQALNARNSLPSGKNPTGVVGVTYHEENRNGILVKKYYARIMVNGKGKTKSFCVGKYTEEEAFGLACKWREQMLLEANAQGAGFTPHHGK